MGQAERITIRVDNRIKKGMDRKRDVNWPEKIRDFLRKELGKDYVPSKLEMVIEHLKRDGRWDLLKAMFLYAAISDNSVYKNNLSLMFGGDDYNKPEDIENEVVELIRSIDVTDRYDIVRGERPFYEVLQDMLIGTGIIDHFEKEMQDIISKERDEVKKALYYIGQYMNFDGDMEGFYTCFPAKQLEILFSHVFDEPKEMLKELNRQGIIFYNYYESNAYSYGEYCVPIYTYELLREITEHPELYLLSEFRDMKSKIENILSDDRTREFLKWLGEDFTMDFYGDIYLSKVKEEFSEKFGKNAFDETLSYLVKEGILVPHYWPHRRSAGGSSSMPARLYYNLTPRAKKCLYEVVFEKCWEKLRVGGIYEV